MTAGQWSDPHRPIYHFTPDRDRYRINDPNGLIQWKGRYHLFYQYNPYGPYLDNTHWGHAVSDDLAHWEHLPIALAPNTGGPDSEGCYSGCAIDDNGTPTVIYTGIEPERPCLATSDDDLVTWEKYSGNPIINQPPPGREMVGFRDHSVWRENGHWFQVIGAGTKDSGGDALLYKSTDLRDWEFLGSLMAEPPEDSGTMWECPDFFPLGDKHVLIVSKLPHLMAGDVWRARVRYFSGEYSHQKFRQERLEVLDAGGNFYAPQTMLDCRGRRLMWGWITEGRSRESQKIAGWTGVISLPRLLDIDSSGRLLQWPEEGTEKLRSNHRSIANSNLDSAADLLESVSGDSLELRAKFEVGGAETFGLRVRCSPDDEELTEIVVNARDRTLTIDRTKSSLDPDAVLTTETGNIPPFDRAEEVELVVYLDKSVLEVFFNGYAAASRIYPMRADSLGVGVFANGGDAKLASFDAWDMRSIW